MGPKLAPSQQLYNEFLSKSKSPEISFRSKFVTADEVKIEILSIPKNKSHGLYSCATKILKCVSNTIGDVLADIINRSIALGVYPSKLKRSKIIHIFKTDDETDANNY